MPTSQPKKPEQFQKFENVMRRLIKVPKSAIDEAVKQYDSGKKRTPKSKKRA